MKAPSYRHCMRMKIYLTIARELSSMMIALLRDKFLNTTMFTGFAFIRVLHVSVLALLPIIPTHALSRVILLKCNLLANDTLYNLTALHDMSPKQVLLGLSDAANNILLIRTSGVSQVQKLSKR